ncbi:hypothetical protein [Neolewinella antarctica]|uniref:Uncharacterized protein n=1 Tax=Neolewinella antarctica TaxID=442734 RepID=A0ABX0X8I8_9BACT|nr:hypothetical protein [Neolewinella antarctica]NJC25568.1 hypothetical protein [Neolewinella antarctica]
MEFQRRYFEKLLDQHTSKLEMVQQITQVLNLSKDAVYRRLRGATSLTADEMFRLQQHYRFNDTPGDHTLGSNAARAGTFQFSFGERQIKSPDDYIEQLEGRLRQVRELAGLRLLIASPGIPFFHEMIFPRLFAFKLFIYGSTCWDIPGWRDLRFRPEIIDHQVLDKVYEVGRFSYTVPGRELWTMGILNATLDQIEFMLMSGRLADDQQAFLLLDDVDDLVNHLEAMAKTGRKFLPGEDSSTGARFLPAQNELANNDNVILIDSQHTSTFFATYIMPNFLQSSDSVICDMARDWFNNIDELSTPLGASAGRQRHWYFNRLRQQVANTRERLSSQSRIKF